MNFSANPCIYVRQTGFLCFDKATGEEERKGFDSKPEECCKGESVEHLSIILLLSAYPPKFISINKSFLLIVQ